VIAMRRIFGLFEISHKSEIRTASEFRQAH
jgi:hypothetical protein